MKNSEIQQQIEKILDEWDPIGILQDVNPIAYQEGAIGEYNNYIKPIINTFLDKKSMYDYLVKLHTSLRDEPSEYIKEEIELVAKRIVDCLYQYDLKDIRDSC